QDQVEDRPVQEPPDDRASSDRNQADDQAVTQFDQMLDERHRAAFLGRSAAKLREDAHTGGRVDYSDARGSGSISTSVGPPAGSSSGVAGPIEPSASGS